MKSAIVKIITSVIASVVSALIINLLTTSSFSLKFSWTVYLSALLIGVCVFFLISFIRFRRMGIIKILPTSDRGEGATSTYMTKATRSISFVGIAASKWVKNEEILKDTIRRICSQNSGYIRFLILDPSSDAARKLTMSNKSVDNASIDYNNHSVSDKINQSLQRIKSLVAEVSNNDRELVKHFEVRLYRQMPVFRLAIIDERCAYFSFYQRGVDGTKLKQLVIKPALSSNMAQENVFISMNEYFDSLWNADTTVCFDLFDENKFEQ